MVGRLGGDEFAVLAWTNHASAVEAIATRIREDLGEPIPFGDQTLTISASIGIAELDSSVGADGILAAADEAMYEAKRRGGDQWMWSLSPVHERVRTSATPE